MPNITVGGTAPAGQPPQDNPIALGVNDGTNIRAMAGNSAGNPHIDGAAASGAAISGNPVQMGGCDGSNAQYILVNPQHQQSVMTEGQKPTYSFSVTGFSPVATPTDLLCIVGSGTKTVRVTKVEMSGTSTAATAAVLDLQVIKRSTAGTIAPGAFTALTGVPHDSSDAAATAVVNTVGTANFGVLGATIGQVAARKFPFTLTPFTATDFPVATPTIITFTNNNEKGIVLRGVAQQLCLNFAGAALPAGTLLNINVTVTEE